MKKILALCAVVVWCAATNAFALPIVDADPGVNVGTGSGILSVNFTLGEFNSSSIDLSAISAAIADAIDIPISYLAINDLPINPGLGPPPIPGIPLGPPTDLPGIGNNPPSSIPEPASLLLFGAGLIGLASMSRRALRT